ncbi:MAG TPA: S41 family peptidase [Planctomycetota bacterium]|nr:S41 family peptidase [Planctomycetota bacterium]
MSSRIVRLFAVALGLASLLPAQRRLSDGPAISPFRGMRAVEKGIEVQVADDTWFALESVAGVDTATLLREAERLAGRNAWKRLTEDLPALLNAMGHEVGETVDLKVRDLATKEIRELPAVKMTEENRKRLWQANRAARPPASEAAAAAATLSAADARADLAELRRLLDEQFAYRTLRSVDLDKLMQAAGASLGSDAVEGAAFVRIVDRILRAFGDGHSRVDGVPPVSDTFLPFLVQEVAGGHVAFLADRSGLVDAERPFVTAIDGVELGRWLAGAKARATQGSPTMQAREAERLLRDLGDLRAELKLAANEKVGVTLRGKSGTRDVTLDTTNRKPAYGSWPRTETRMLDGNIGYLRIDQMAGEAEFLDGLDASMQTFRATKGLVIDVRGNGGGSRDALRRLAPYLLPAKGAPVVGNVAAILLQKGVAAGPDALADRGLYQADWPGWTDAQRAAITTFARSFRPSWKLPDGKFSPWHFLVLDKKDNEKAFDYDKKVVVLIDRGCFSATDVFAAALGALPNVTLVGEATSGGSGRAAGHRLPKSGVRLQLSTMASFRPDGVLFEGNGVVPDVAVPAEPVDLVGGADSVLQRALELLR